MKHLIRLVIASVFMLSIPLTLASDYRPAGGSGGGGGGAVDSVTGGTNLSTPDTTGDVTVNLNTTLTGLVDVTASGTVTGGKVAVDYIEIDGTAIVALDDGADPPVPQDLRFKFSDGTAHPDFRWMTGGGNTVMTLNETGAFYLHSPKDTNTGLEAFGVTMTASGVFSKLSSGGSVVADDLSFGCAANQILIRNSADSDWECIDAPVFNVRNYGTDICTGTVDSTTAIAAAITAAFDAGGGVVSIPSGATCTIATPITMKSNVTLSCGPGSTLKAAASYSSAVGLLHENSAAVTNVTIRGCTIDMNRKKGEAITLDHTGTGGIIIRDVEILGEPTGVVASVLTYTALKIGCASYTGDSCAHLNNVTVTAPRQCINEAHGACLVNGDCSTPVCLADAISTHMTGIHISGTGRAEVINSTVTRTVTANIRVENPNSLIADNYLESGRAIGISAEGSGTIVSGNNVQGVETISALGPLFRDSPSSGDDSFVQFTGNTHSLPISPDVLGYKIHGNYTTVSDCIGYSIGYTGTHILIAKDSSGEPKFAQQVVISGCNLLNGLYGIRHDDVAGNSNNVRIIGNQLKGVTTGVEASTGWHLIGNTINWSEGSVGDWGRAAVVLGTVGTYGGCTNHSVITGNSFHGYPLHSLIEVPVNGYACDDVDSQRRCDPGTNKECVDSKCNSMSLNYGEACDDDDDCTALVACGGGEGSCTQQTCSNIAISGNMFFTAASAAENLINLGLDDDEVWGPKVTNMVITGNTFTGATANQSAIAFPPSRDADFTNIQIGLNSYSLTGSGATRLVNWTPTMGTDWFANRYDPLVYGDGRDGPLILADGSNCPAICVGEDGSTVCDGNTCTLPLNSAFGGNGSALYSADYSFTEVSVGDGMTLKMTDAGVSGGCNNGYGQTLHLRATGTVDVLGTIDVSGLGACPGTANTQLYDGSSPGGGSYGASPGTSGGSGGAAAGDGGDVFNCSNQTDCKKGYDTGSLPNSPIQRWTGHSFNPLHGMGGAKAWRNDGGLDARDADGSGGSLNYIAALGAGGGGGAYCDGGTLTNFGGTQGGGGLAISAVGTITVNGDDDNEGTLDTSGVDTADITNFDLDNPTGGGGTMILQTATAVSENSPNYDTAGGTQTGAAECTNSAGAGGVKPAGKGGFGAVLLIKLD